MILDAQDLCQVASKQLNILYYFDLSYTFENEEIFRIIALTQKHVSLNITLISKAFDFSNAIHNAQPLQVLK